MKVISADQLPPKIMKQVIAQQEYIKGLNKLSESVIKKYTPFVKHNEIERLFWQPIIRFTRDWLHYNGSSERFQGIVKDDDNNRQTSKQVNKTPNGAI